MSATSDASEIWGSNTVQLRIVSSLDQFSDNMENTKRSPSTSVSDELRAAREDAKEKQERAAQAIKEAEEALAEIARLSGVEPT